MSMNLCFRSKGGYHVDFPFQTPTSLTYDVLGEKNLDKRIALVHKYIQSIADGDDEWAIRKKCECESMMRDTHLILEMI